MKKQDTIIKDKYHAYGLVAVIASALFYALGCATNLGEDQFFAVFVVNYGISAIYFCSLWFTGRFRREKGQLDLFFLSLVLFLISAYSLNHGIPVFQQSAGWLNVVLILVGMAYCSTGFFEKVPPFWRNLIAFVMGLGFILFLYLSIYLLPLYPLSLIASVALGISLHSFAPLLFVIFTLIWLSRKVVLYRKALWYFVAGGLSLIIVGVVFCLQWYSLERYVASKYQHSLVDEDTDLPSWIKVAESLPDNWVTERYLKAGLVYSTPDHSGDIFGWRMPARSFEETKKHDPLVMTAAFFNIGKGLSEEERIKILESEYDARHKTEDRLWSGSDLTTTHVISDVRIWPQFRMAYTEKTITVANSNTNERWNNQEGIYTFHLPEGGVVTSLSLWINGQEAKGILTTKGKADSAYKEIVGVEVRDPSVVHWQEGNRVSVRVYPVIAGESRIFRIGITAPLAYRDNRLSYENIYFEGPEAAGAKELVRVHWMQRPDNSDMEGFEEKGENRFSMERSYRKDWDLSCKAPALQPASFSFSGYTYGVQAYRPAPGSTVFHKVFLDVNASWNEDEFMKIITLLKQKELYVYDDGLIQVHNENALTLFKRLQQKHFSLFPLQAIGEPETSLLITKSSKASPDISDLKGTAFGTRLEHWLNRDQQLCIFNLGDQLNPYLKTLKEHRAFRYEQGDTEQLVRDCRDNVFASDTEDADHVVVHKAGLTITRTAGTLQSQAPDHVMRLFAYNHLMQQLKQGLYANREADSTLVQETQQAYIVTPVSSLVVLETAADYQRFGIKDTENSLHNASMHSKGAVPEPHEWALIIIAVLVMAGLYYRNKPGALWNK